MNENEIRNRILQKLYEFWKVNAKEWMGGGNFLKATEIPDETAVTRNLSFLEDMGYVETAKAGKDILKVRITATGITHAENEGIVAK